MPPFVPRKRHLSADPPPAKRQVQAKPATPAAVVDVSDSDSDLSSLSDVPESGLDTPQGLQGPKSGNSNSHAKLKDDDDDEEEDEEEEDEDIDWEDAIDPTSTSATTPNVTGPQPELQDLELTLDQNEQQEAPELANGKKGPSKIERQIRVQSHCMHVQCLLFHNTIRNAWINDEKVHEILRKKLPEGINKEIKRFRVASGLELPEPKPQPPKGSKKKKNGKQARKNKDWSEDSQRLEPGQPDMSRGDPIIGLLKVLVAYWRKQYRITAPGLRKHGYRPIAAVEATIKDFRDEEHDPEKHGERIANKEEFRTAAERMQGSRDLGAQLFTALIRALKIEARLVGSLQPLGFGWTKAETYTGPSKTSAKSVVMPAEKDSEDSQGDSADEEDDRPTTRNRQPQYDRDMPFPIYWTEVASPVTHEVIPVDPLILSNAVATTPELQAAFEPRGAKADRSKQVICYVVAHSADGSAKDVTTRYLKRRTWPGKTKGFRMPVEKIPLPGHRRGQYHEFDWFRVVMRPYARPADKRTEVDEIEDKKDLLRKQPEKKKADQTTDTLQSLRQSPEFTLERFLRREEALVPGAEPVRMFTSGKGVKAKQEPVYRRADVVKCMSAESWHKEGRQILPGAVPLKRVPIRSVTLRRKREVDELQRETGEKPTQGLYSRNQTEFIVPPPIVDGCIPKNDYGNIDCFVPSMVPRGASHVPLPGTVRICKKLGIDYAEAVTGFEFGSKMAVPVIQGVVIAAENEDLLRDAWRIDAEEKCKREELKAEKRILQTWRKFLFGLRIKERVQEEYGAFDATHDRERDSYNPFAARQKGHDTPELDPDVDFPDHDEEFEHGDTHDPLDHGGGFLLPGEEADAGADDDLIVEHHRENRKRAAPVVIDSEDDDLSILSSENEEDEGEDEDGANAEEDEDEDEDEDIAEEGSGSDYVPGKRK
ncbi:Uncharacterized protein PECH_004578 [Penicillium ucsense]|uniref:Rad4 beta-hairpin domain-containing protein n=1 Tax=Penicillium ucsense TaxID=2839758 RepID=A0A8J8W232_9EURO|nr:Uncharacterized protein PECM_006201 [Penicillium ucsense]KAF7736924.1 Uncharacterized protein PECH_004578 [Penicillium ucsense]